MASQQQAGSLALMRWILSLRKDDLESDIGAEGFVGYIDLFLQRFLRSCVQLNHMLEVESQEDVMDFRKRVQEVMERIKGSQESWKSYQIACELSSASRSLSQIAQGHRLFPVDEDKLLYESTLKDLCEFIESMN